MCRERWNPFSPHLALFGIFMDARDIIGRPPLFGAAIYFEVLNSYLRQVTTQTNIHRTISYNITDVHVPYSQARCTMHRHFCACGHNATLVRSPRRSSPEAPEKWRKRGRNRELDCRTRRRTRAPRSQSPPSGFPVIYSIYPELSAQSLTRSFTYCTAVTEP